MASGNREPDGVGTSPWNLAPPPPTTSVASR